MSKAMIIAVVGALLILCVGAQMFSLNESETDNNVTQNYYYMR